MSTLKTNNIQHVDRSDPSIIINTDGSVNIAGTMTYEDVTNVDAVGIITGRSNIDAQKQVHVGTGVSVKAGGLNVTAGITTVQALQATSGTFSAAVQSVGLTNTISSGNVIALMDSSNASQNHRVRINSQGASSSTSLAISNSNANNQTSLVHGNDGVFSIRGGQTAGSEPTSGTERFRIDTSGNVTLTGDKLKVFNAGAPQVRINSDTGDGASTRLTIGRATATNNFVNGSAAGDSAITFPSNLIFGVQTAEKVRISSNGNILVGKTADAGKGLEIYASNNSALRIQNSSTGQGAGDGLLIETAGSEALFWNYENAAIRFATNNTERARIDSVGALLVAHTSGRNNFNSAVSTEHAPIIQLEGTNQRRAISVTSTNNVDGGLLILARQNGDPGANTVVSSGDQVGRVDFQASGGTNMEVVAQVTAEVDGTPGDNDMPGRLLFKTTADGANAASERIRINSSGNVSVGTAVNAGNALRYLDVANFNTGSSAGSIIRLLTTKNDGTGSVGLDIVKYKTGGAYFNNYETDGTNGFISFGTGTGGGSVAERLRVAAGGQVNIGGNYTQTTYGLSVRGGAVDQNVQFSNTKTTNGNIHYFGVTLSNAGYGQALFGHTGHTTAGEQAAWMGLAGDNVAGGTGIKCFRGGTVVKNGQPAFQAYGGAHATAAGNYLVVSTEVFDVRGDYNASTGVFTAPMAGKYLFTVTGVYTLNTSSATWKLTWHVNNANAGVAAEWQTTNIGSSYNTIGNSSIIYHLAENDTVRLYIEGSSFHISGIQSRFCGYFLG